MEFNLQNSKIKKPGTVILQNFQLIQTPNFVDYLKSGLQLNLVVAIDFTGSNGIPTSASSLHYIVKQPTQYQVVMKSIWDIV
jgi:archaellum component FlaG (FlaF/FlaG flagellin family)